jgi:hypothetical protein
VHDIEDFISKFAKKEHCSNNDEHGKSSNYAHEIIGFQELFELFAFGPCIDVDNAVKNGPENRAIPCNLMKNIEAFVGVGCEERKGCVLEGKEGDECEVRYSNPE